MLVAIDRLYFFDFEKIGGVTSVRLADLMNKIIAEKER